MTGKPENYEELTRLISALLEGRLSEPERARLDALLQADPRARWLYMQMIDQEVELSCLLVPAGAQSDNREKILPLPQSLPAAVTAPSPRRWRRWRLAAAAAVVLLIGTALALVLSRNPSPAPTTISKQVIADLIAPDAWSEDFEQGQLRGWTGTLVSTNLPPGSRFGIATVVRDFPAGESVRTIQLPEDWHQGLFALTTGSTLHVSFRLANRAHINVFMHTIPSDPAVNGYEMYQLAGAPFWGRSGEWRTISIPFSQFVRKIVVRPRGTREFVGGPPQSGELTTTLSFSSVEQTDFVIDRVWVTPGSPREQAAPNQNPPQ